MPLIYITYFRNKSLIGKLLLDFFAIFRLTDRNLLCIKDEDKWNELDCSNGSPGFCMKYFFCEKSPLDFKQDL